MYDTTIGIGIGLSLVAMGLGLVALLLSAVSVAFVVGLKNSTHRIQYLPLNEAAVEEEDENPIDTSAMPERNPFTNQLKPHPLSMDTMDEEYAGGDWSNSRLR